MAEITPRADGERRHRNPRVAGRDAAPAVLVRSQGGVPRRRPHLARLLLHRRHDPARVRCRACCGRSRTGRASSALPCANVFHAGDGNLHPLILFDANEPGDKERTVEFGDRILQLCIDVGGTITGEHGVGIEKLGGMCAQFRAGRARTLSGHQGGVRRRVAAQSGQGRSHACTLRRVRPDARASRRVAPSRTASFLKTATMNSADAIARRGRNPRPSTGVDGPAAQRLRRPRADDARDPRAAFATARVSPTPRCPTSSCSRTRNEEVAAIVRLCHAARVPGDRVRRRHVARRARRGAVRRRVPRPVADESRARGERRGPRLPRAGGRHARAAQRRAQGHRTLLPDRSGRQRDDRRHGVDARVGHQRRALRHDARERARPHGRHARTGASSAPAAARASRAPATTSRACSSAPKARSASSPRSSCACTAFRSRFRLPSASSPT